jgi:hypothetical protein
MFLGVWWVGGSRGIWIPNFTIFSKFSKILRNMVYISQDLFFNDEIAVYTKFLGTRDCDFWPTWELFSTIKGLAKYNKYYFALNYLNN